MRSYRIGVIPGDGIGREVVPAACAVLAACHSALQLIELEAGWDTFQRSGTALPASTVDTLGTCDGALFGAVASPSRHVPGYSSPILNIRRIFDLYANLRPALSAPVAGSHRGVDLLIVRENTECLYVKRERWEAQGEHAVAERVITRRASRRVAEMAFRLAQGRSGRVEGRRPHVCIVHKANVLSLTDGLFRETALQVAHDYPDVDVEDQLVDSMIYHLIREPQRYDVILTPNLYGDIISDAAAALVGGLGLVSSANVGETLVVAEPVHGSAPDIAGRGVANPLATVRAAAQLLTHLGETDAARWVDAAVLRVMEEGPHTPDLGGRATTMKVADAVVQALGFVRHGSS